MTGKKVIVHAAIVESENPFYLTHREGYDCPLTIAEAFEEVNSRLSSSDCKISFYVPREFL